MTRLDPVDLQEFLQNVMKDAANFAEANSHIRLRSYQTEVARAILHSVHHQLGMSFVVMFPRQSGKNELQAQIEAYLLTILCREDADIVKISPTWKPQSLNAMHRLERLLKNGVITRRIWKKESGFVYRVGRARVSFFSGEPQAHIVGATASALLEVDEAQDVAIDKYDKEIAPMAASTNATRVFWGTAWTSQTLLARELRSARELEKQDGLRRAFVIDGERVAMEVNPYGGFLQEQVRRLGRMHPMVRTQFYSEEIDEEAGMFPNARQQLMQGTHAHQNEPQPGRIYAFLLDVGGEQLGGGDGEDGSITKREHDSTAMTIVEVDLSTLADEVLKAPTYRVVHRQVWYGVGQPELFAQIKSMTGMWLPRKIIVDATGIGAGLAAFLQKALAGKVMPFLFTSQSKSRLGWDFLSVCDTSRFQDYAKHTPDLVQEEFWRQVNYCQMEAGSAPGWSLRWGVPDGTLDPSSHKQVHDDLLISASMCALLDGVKWNLPAFSGGFIRARDPLDGMELGF